MKGENQHPAPSQGNAQWQYTQETQATNATAPAAPTNSVFVPQEVEWTASEFIAHNKGMGWFAAVGAGSVLLAAIIYLVTHDILSAVIIIVVAILLAVSGSRKPRVLHYRINDSGLAIGDKFYPYSEFKSFSVMEEGAFSSVMFLPLKRFMPPISIYYEPADEERIINVIAYFLPLENRRHDVIDNLVRRIRF
ncbi:MAG TPA: hypothetical protein VLA92_04885 [Candidatus Saccharimonadales bacterium]|nr:hypothetical protein [Candidatus Saccharimonadales bacterium]